MNAKGYARTLQKEYCARKQSVCYCLGPVTVYMHHVFHVFSTGSCCVFMVEFSYQPLLQSLANGHRSFIIRLKVPRANFFIDTAVLERGILQRRRLLRKVLICRSNAVNTC